MFPSFVDIFKPRRPEEEELSQNVLSDPYAEGVTVDIDSPNFRNLTAVGQPNMPDAPYLNEHDIRDVEGVFAPEPDVFNSPEYQSQANERFAEHLANLPIREKSSIWQKIIAGATAGLTGAVEGPSRGLAAGRGMLDRPYDDAVERWKMEAVPLQGEAAREDRFNELVIKSQSQAEYRKYLRERDRDKLLSGLSASREKIASKESTERNRQEDKVARRDEGRLNRESRERIAGENRAERGTRGKKEKGLTEGDKKALRKRAKANLVGDPKHYELFAKADRIKAAEDAKTPTEETLTVADKAAMLLAVEDEYERLLKMRSK